MKRTIPDEPFIAAVALRRERVPSFEEYPYCIPAVRHLTSLTLHPRVTFFVGENGTGKSTLLEAIAVADGMNAEGGTRNSRLATRETHSRLFEVLQLERTVRRRDRSDSFFLRAESFYNVASYIDQLGWAPVDNPYGPVSLHEQSHGEAFLTLFTRRLAGNGLYLLDEPESALSPQCQLAFLTVLHRLAARGSQFLIATHSPIIMAYPHALIYGFSEKGIAPVTYEDTEHFRITRAFLLRREKILEDLLRDESDGLETDRGN